MDIKSGSEYPASALSNFEPYLFRMDGVLCSSMEGFLQSLKFEELDLQNEVCKLVGYEAKKRGKHKIWQDDQVLWWRREPYARKGPKYQLLLNRAFCSLYLDNHVFRTALHETGDAILTHSIGRTAQSETVLTRDEFCSRLMKLRSLDPRHVKIMQMMEYDYVL